VLLETTRLCERKQTKKSGKAKLREKEGLGEKKDVIRQEDPICYKILRENERNRNASTCIEKGGGGEGGKKGVGTAENDESARGKADVYIPGIHLEKFSTRPV